MFETVKPQHSSPLPWYYTRSMVFVMIFLVACAFALPFLWLSPAFSAKEKVFWSVVGAIWTVIVVGLIIWMALFLWHLWTTVLFGCMAAQAASGPSPRADGPGASQP